MDTIIDEILAHIAVEPENFDGREELWMAHENLRAVQRTEARS